MSIVYDVIIIGGGPAGMMAAGTAASLGKSVLVVEKNPSVGKKLLITGGGRCNVTNINSDLKKIYKESAKYLSSTFSQFSFDDGLKFFNDNDMETKVEPGGRVFPKSNSSSSVLKVLLDYMKKGKVTIKTNNIVKSIEKEKDIFKIILNTSQILKSKSCIVATGGISHPETGSTGDGFNWLKSLGHNIVKNDFALVPLALREDWAKDLSGATFDDVKITVTLDRQKAFSKRGRILFTHFGISGPTILNMSKKIGDLLHTGEVKLVLDIFPTKDIGSLRTTLNEVLNRESNRMLRNSIGSVIPKSLIPAILKVGDIDGDIYNHSVKKEIRYKIVDTIKNLPVTVESLMGSDKAIVSSGGVNLSEIDMKTMESKIVKDLFIIGDLLNVDRPSGGYSLALCWTTGYVAGVHC